MFWEKKIFKHINQKGFINILLVVIIVALVGAGIYFVTTRQTTPTPALTPTPTPSPTPLSTPITDATKCTNYSVVKLNNDQGFTYTYYNSSDLKNIPEKKFEGILQQYEKLPPGVSTTVMRTLTYNLDGKGIYTTKDDLSKYVGKRVILIGKNYKFELEGTQRDEIWPISIVCK